jgi:hypothetical protein|tara:strand:- start:106 stop:432 length:327 start_codon:yes stop_codon:yes gene_type:complete
MKNIKILILVSIFVLMSGCQDVKQGLTGQKQENSDEFLVKKKNKLVLPPNFEKLPMPTISTEEENSNKNYEEDIKKLLGLSSTNNKTTKIVKEKSKIESKILEKINAK